jgi:signal peptidase I
MEECTSTRLVEAKYHRVYTDDWQKMLFVGAGLAFLLLGLRAMLLVVKVQNQSMLPTLADGDRALAVRRYPHVWLRKGQVVLVCWPWPVPSPSTGPFGCVPFIKRIVGLPGETVTLAVPTLFKRGSDGEFRPTATEQRTYQVPPGHVFVCGDNLEGIEDSRLWGPIPLQAVIGLVLR